MGRIIAVLLVGLAPLLVLAVRGCPPSPPPPTVSPPPPPAEVLRPADEISDPLPVPALEPTAPEEIPVPAEPGDHGAGARMDRSVGAGPTEREETRRQHVGAPRELGTLE